MTWTVQIEQDEDDGGIVPLPDELLAQLKLGVGDTLFLSEECIGGIRCLVLSKTPRTTDQDIPRHE